MRVLIVIRIFNLLIVHKCNNIFKNFIGEQIFGKLLKVLLIHESDNFLLVFEELVHVFDVGLEEFRVIAVASDRVIGFRRLRSIWLSIGDNLSQAFIFAKQLSLLKYQPFYLLFDAILLQEGGQVILLDVLPVLYGDHSMLTTLGGGREV